MSSKHFCLKWNSYQTNILNAFESLQNTEDLTDVTLTCEGINLKAHKIILSACSPYFRTVFKENPCSHPIVILKDVSYTDLIAIIKFMYHGEVFISEDQLSSFLQTARLLQISGLNGSSEAFNRITPVPSKKTKPINRLSDVLESPLKKVKLPPVSVKNKILPKMLPSAATSGCNNSASSLIETNEREDSPLETDVNKIKMEEVIDDRESCSDINENVEVIVEDSLDQQTSILEAALEIKEPKVGSILERSLTAQPNTSQGKSPMLPFPVEQINVKSSPEVLKTILLPRKPPDQDIDRLGSGGGSTSRSSNSSSPQFDRPADLLQQSIKIEGEVYDNVEVISADDVIQREAYTQTTRIEQVMHPHHNSLCGYCPHCGQLYSNQSALKYHVRLVHSDLTNMYCCHLCPESFDYREGYKKHMADVHCIRN